MKKSNKERVELFERIYPAKIKMKTAQLEYEKLKTKLIKFDVREKSVKMFDSGILTKKRFDLLLEAIG